MLSLLEKEIYNRVEHITLQLLFRFLIFFRCIRIWLVGIQKPLITLKYRMAPVHLASWSITHSTIIVALYRNSLDVWDLNRSILKPVSSLKVEQEPFYTTFK